MTTPLYSWSRPVEFAETDAAGLVHFSQYYRWMEATEHAFLTSKGIAVLGGELIWPRVQADCQFKGPIRFGNQVVVNLVQLEIGGRSITYHFEIRSQEDEHLAASGRLTTVCARLEGQHIQVVDIPDDLRNQLTPPS